MTKNVFGTKKKQTLQKNSIVKSVAFWRWKKYEFLENLQRIYKMTILYRNTPNDMVRREISMMVGVVKKGASKHAENQKNYQMMI